jgi:peptide/nickel transport system ATP-binding protein
MRQRIAIAMALACKPDILIADEPTTALDVTVQAQILRLIKDMQREMGMATILITHDLGVVNEIADRVLVMYSGRVIESGPKEDILFSAKHPYTSKLIAAVPKIDSTDTSLHSIEGQVRPATKFVDGCRFAERCDFAADRCLESTPPDLYSSGAQSVACFLFDPGRPLPAKSPGSSPLNQDSSRTTPSSKVILEIDSLRTWFPVRAGIFRSTVGHVKAVDDISLRVFEGETIALVGESGCGKSTLGQTILRLVNATSGSVKISSENLSVDVLNCDQNQLKTFRQKAQIIFQDPFASLNPRFSVREIIEEGLRIHAPDLSEDERDQKIGDILEEVGLPRDSRFRYPHEFSGGQRQRVAIARALVLRPEILILDEATSALDVSIQAQVLNLLRQLQSRYKLTYIFITHNLGVVSYMADHIAVMYLGKIVETGETQKILTLPAHPYTRKLVSSVPSMQRGALLPEPLGGDVPSPVNPPRGCAFHPRCPLKKEMESSRLDTTPCVAQLPNLLLSRQGTNARCHFADLPAQK